ncbi:MFS transporter [Streptomyces sp. MI02-7b]|uniref:MFS transporter n=1 Tax=Streptomyces sp. MI02-7b TaxID=462941 RepID=UPI0029B2F13F|nr:MFS transporter [Streptomyces sp. MI02-7b]MDX3075809.1 MFS transporter [Streptomyces sp. MI02-7b]
MTLPTTAPLRAASHRRTLGYGAVLRTPQVAFLMLATHIGRLPGGMTPLAVMFVVAADGGGLAHRGMLAAAYGLAAALGQPLLGRLADRRGQTLPLTGGAAVSAAALTAAAVLDTTTWPGVGCVVLGGAASPPLESCLRAVLPDLLSDRTAVLKAAYALDSSAQEIVYVVGPLLVTVLATTLSPKAALLAVAVVGLVGSLLVAASKPLRRWRPTPRRRDLVAALRPRGMRLVLVAFFAVGIVLGGLNVAAAAAADRHDALWMTGALPAALSLAGVTGGLVYGRRAWPGSRTVQLQTLAALFALAWLPLLLMDPPPVLALALITVPGGLWLPLLTVGYQVVDDLAVPGTVTEAFGWLVAVVNVGLAVGTGLGGRMDHGYELCALAAAAAALTLLAHRTTTPVPSPHPRET